MKIVFQKKIRLVFFLCLLVIFLSNGIVLANDGPHGDYLYHSDLCALCHRTHTAGSEALLLSPLNGNAFCMTCHDGTGASTETVISTHGNLDFSAGVEESFVLSCIQCHNPHGDEKNLYLIRQEIYPYPDSNETLGMVSFTAKTGDGSYDDGSGSGICVLCHTVQSMQNHDGGADHLGGINFEGSNCLTCHPHSVDSEQNTLDGFMADASCTGCHGQQINSRRQITGTDGDFSLTSHHIQGDVQDEDCVVCHDTSQHAGGNVRLINVDSGEFIQLLEYPADHPEEAQKLAAFCLACHDEDGAAGNRPFHDQIEPPVIADDLWQEASHALSGNTCFTCHNNGHGSVKSDLLSPWNADTDASLPDDPYRTQEGFCYLCHGSDGPASTNIAGEFDSLSRHHITASDQIDGSRLECINCHNPHLANQANPLMDPDDPQQPWTEDITTFCLRCHDGEPPLSVSFPEQSPGTGYDKSAFLESSHETAISGEDDCRACHYHHGTPDGAGEFPSLLKAQYSLMDNYAYPPIGMGSDFDLCWTCHDETYILGGQGTINNFEKRHSTHVLKVGGTTCLTCHDTHAPYQPNEPGLINFLFAVNNPNYDIRWINPELPEEQNAADSFQIIPETNRGSCSLVCHGNYHNNTTYSRLDPLE